MLGYKGVILAELCCPQACNRQGAPGFAIFTVCAHDVLCLFSSMLGAGEGPVSGHVGDRAPGLLDGTSADSGRMAGSLTSTLPLGPGVLD